MRTIGPLVLLSLACANPFGAPEESPPPPEPVAPSPPAAPVEPAIPVNERVERVVTPAGDGNRISWLHVPSRRLKSTPLVVVLHGGRETDPRLFARKVDHWFDRGVAFVFAGSRDRPERAKAKGKGKSAPDDPPEGKVGKGRGDTDEDDLAWQEPEDAKFVETLVSDIVATKGIDPSRVYVVGLGSGAELVWKLACTSRRFAGFGVVSGGLSHDQASVCPMPGLPARLAVFQATEDPWLLWTGDETYVAVNEAVRQFGKQMDCDLSGTTDTARDDLDPEDGMTVTQRDWTCPDGALRLYEIAGATHGWPSRTPGRGLDTPHDIDTMDELGLFWGFPKVP